MLLTPRSQPVVAEGQIEVQPGDAGPDVAASGCTGCAVDQHIAETARKTVVALEVKHVASRQPGIAASSSRLYYSAVSGREDRRHVEAERRQVTVLFADMVGPIISGLAT